MAYNRFRYYDNESGGYISQDPIGLDSKVYNLYSYVKNTNCIVDIFGLDWNYILENSDGESYYHGRVSDGTSMEDVARRHATNVGDDGPRFGEGDKIRQITDPGTPRDAVRGIEQRGIGDDVLGKNNPNVRGNKIRGMSEAKQKTVKGRRRLKAADDILKGKNVSDMPSKRELSFDSKFAPHH